ncbi:FAD binding domain-containing protein [Mycena maculata]|uniref:FAD binding domain-containing protein n=1 Tax=Mycena maculata TaxID=230809 RepID=A0AAD7IZX7_9AGAR|nr:FAD binding domain-containing protein [Mycena maculata]
MTPSVLIVGAGPTGLILALILLQNGVSVRIINKEVEHRIGSRGAGIQARTLELYDILGILLGVQKEGEPFKKEGQLDFIAIYNPGETEPVKVVPANWVQAPPDTPHVHGLMIGQDTHERVLREYLQKLGATIELATELHSFEQFPDHVVAHLIKTDAAGQQHEERTEFNWLIGTDGAHSIVRKQLGFTFLGETRTEQNMAVGDIVIEGLDNRRFHMWNVSPNSILLRWNHSSSQLFSYAYTGRADEKTLTREEFIEEFHALTGRHDLTFGEAAWMSSYTPNIRMVDRMRDGRVFIAGDAAHCHSPAGGQGLNSCIQDASNLGWKLALVEKGLAPPTLLDTYGEERLRVIAQMLQLTTKLHDKTWANGTLARSERPSELSMLGVNYAGSSIVLEGEGASRAGSDAYTKVEGGRVLAAYRAPDAPGLVRVGSADAPTTLFAIFCATAHSVLVFGGDAAARTSVADVVARLPKDSAQLVVLLQQGATSGVESEVSAGATVLEDRAWHAYRGYGLDAGELTIVVVRPDGVVGAVVSAAEGVETYFRKIFV